MASIQGVVLDSVALLSSGSDVICVPLCAVVLADSFSLRSPAGVFRGLKPPKWGRVLQA